MSAASSSNGRIEFVLDMAPLIYEFGNLTQGVGVNRTKIAGSDVVGPTLEVGCSFLSCGTHCFPNPLRNFGRARMAWITAVPSSSVTTPTSNGSALVDGPMNIVTAPSLGSKARQYVEGRGACRRRRLRACGRSPRCPLPKRNDEQNDRQHMLTHSQASLTLSLSLRRGALKCREVAGSSTGDEGDDDVCGVAVEVLSAPVVDRGGARIGVAGSELDVA